jgi:hypothetical protein
MLKNSQSAGAFFRSSFMPLLVTINLLFSAVFVIAICFQAVQKKEQNAASAKTTEPKSGIISPVTLGNIHSN